jgi:transcriptional regulator with XRE-family HTH domain
MAQQAGPGPGEFRVEGLDVQALGRLAEIVTEILEENGWSYRQAGVLMGMSHGEVHRLSQGLEPNPKVAVLLTIQRVAGLPSLEDLLGEIEFPSMRIIR